MKIRYIYRHTHREERLEWRIRQTYPTYGGGAYYAYGGAFGRARPPRLFLRGTPSSLNAWSRTRCRSRAGTHRPAVRIVLR